MNLSTYYLISNEKIKPSLPQTQSIFCKNANYLKKTAEKRNIPTVGKINKRMFYMF